MYNKKQYDKEYLRQNIVYRKMNLNKQVPEDMTLLSWIDSRSEGTSAYLKKLVRNDMTGGQTNDKSD